MSNTYAVRELSRRLSEDKWRVQHPFSSDIFSVNSVLFHPFSSEEDKQEALGAWLQRHQPCLFGRVAAPGNALHYVFLEDDDLRESDQHIADRIQLARQDWWRRSRFPKEGISAPAHGFVLCVVSQRVNFAEPNEILRQLAEEILKLWGCKFTNEPQGKVHWEELFLKKPDTEEYFRFEFSVDFFASAGDGRWWQDHRMPGGLAFTANSVGHMRRFREWYEGKPDQENWLLETAMGTIARAANTEYGQATWLRTLVDGRAFVTEIACPISKPRPGLVGYDWTRYAGHLHTDHAVRPEFFRVEPEKPPEAKHREWLQDFQYLYDPASRDHVRFVDGVNVSKQEVDEKVGKPEDYTTTVSARKPKARRETEAGISASDRRAEIERLLDICRAWKLDPDEKRDLAG